MVQYIILCSTRLYIIVHDFIHILTNKDFKRESYNIENTGFYRNLNTFNTVISY